MLDNSELKELRAMLHIFYKKVYHQEKVIRISKKDCYDNKNVLEAFTVIVNRFLMKEAINYEKNNRESLKKIYSERFPVLEYNPNVFFVEYVLSKWNEYYDGKMRYGLSRIYTRKLNFEIGAKTRMVLKGYYFSVTFQEVRPQYVEETDISEIKTFLWNFNNKTNQLYYIFHDDNDPYKFIDLISEYHDGDDADVYAHCHSGFDLPYDNRIWRLSSDLISDRKVLKKRK